MYSKQVTKSTLQHKQIDNMLLKIIRIEECSRGFNRIVCYEISLHSGYRVVYKSVESNLERLWYLYDVVFSAMVE